MVVSLTISSISESPTKLCKNAIFPELLRIHWADLRSHIFFNKMSISPVSCRRTQEPPTLFGQAVHMSAGNTKFFPVRHFQVNFSTALKSASRKFRHWKHQFFVYFCRHYTNAWMKQSNTTTIYPLCKSFTKSIRLWNVENRKFVFSPSLDTVEPTENCGQFMVNTFTFLLNDGFTV